MAKYQLLDISLKQSFANNGLTQRVPYKLSPKDDDLNWLEGFTDAFQRPVLPQADAGNANGRYIKMGQLNQVLQNLSQAILNVKQGLDNVQGVIDDDVSIKIENIITEADKVIKNKVVTWLQTINNQNVAGLKNFTGININNFKTKGNAVANLEWCNGLPIKRILRQKFPSLYFTQTITYKSIFSVYIRHSMCEECSQTFTLNEKIIWSQDEYSNSGGSHFMIGNFFANKGDVLKSIASHGRLFCFYGS